jgi:alcohol oxidase
MMYSRAQGIDFDSWKTPGWTAKDMLPMCNKFETFHQDEQGIDKNKHGYNGPIHISDGGYRGKSEHEFLNTVRKMRFKEIVDLQDLEQCGGFSVSDPDTGLRNGIGLTKNIAMPTICVSRWSASRRCSPLYSPSTSRWAAPEPPHSS